MPHVVARCGFLGAWLLVAGEAMDDEDLLARLR
jgi:hypothetical protein